MNYIGSKHSLLEFIDSSIKSVVGEELKGKIFCDIFAGTGSVGEHFKKQGCRVIANDIQYYSFVLNRHKIGNNKKMEFNSIKDACGGDIEKYLNSLVGVKGYIYQNYSPNDIGDRLYFTRDNAKKCDAIRTKLNSWKKNKQITEDEYYYLLASLLRSIDKRANTASVYGAYLKQFKASAKKPLVFELLDTIEDNLEHKVFNSNANEIIADVETDILYLDPPYNARQYSSNYHVLETIAKYDNPTLKGKSGLREDSIKSNYCSKARVKEEFSDLINKAVAKYIFLSYNNEGLMATEDIKRIMKKKGRYGVLQTSYNRYKADNKREHSANSTTEYLHFVAVNS